ncbi:MAG: glycerol-3-phosphate dehydrogenase, partial [Proteobacteria bacterium]
RWAVSYGSRSWRLIEGAQSVADLGEELGTGLFSREVDYLYEQEWATRSDDVLWRRSKLGLFVDDAAAVRLDAYLAKVDASRANTQAA